MAWYEINHSCGHTDRVQLYGKQSSRDWAIQQGENRKCAECWQVLLKKGRSTPRADELAGAHLQLGAEKEP